MELTDKNIVQKALPPRPEDSNKGSFGTLLSVCGSYGMAGAAIMAGRSALKCGLGLLKCALPKSIYPIAAAQLLESVFLPLDETPDGKISGKELDRLLIETQKSTAVLIGCGLSVCADTKAVVEGFIRECEKPVVLDADALNCICENPEILKQAKSEIIITPHPGEMGRLVKKTAAEINSNRAETAADFAQKYGVVTVLKGSGTIIASPDGKILLNQTGNCGMATGGSGDVLAGMTGAILAQGAKPFEAASAAVYLHGKAGDLAAEKYDKISMLPTDIIECIHLCFRL